MRVSELKQLEINKILEFLKSQFQYVKSDLNHLTKEELIIFYKAKLAQQGLKTGRIR